MLKTITMALLVSIGTVAALPVLAAERQVSFEVGGQRVAGTLVLPNEVERPPVVLMLHGFGGTRNEWTTAHVPKGLFGQAADTLAQRGIASLRIDFRGSGKSEGKFADVTVDGEVKDAVTALAFLHASKDIDSQRISVLGMSLGGAVASAVAAQEGNELRSVVLWNPGINLPGAFTALIGLDEVKKGLSAGDQPVDMPLPNDTKLTLKGEFFQSLYRIIPTAEITRYAGPLLVMVGTKDTLVFPQPLSAEAFLSYHHGEHELWQRPVDHGFDVERSSDTVSALIDGTGDFLQKHFK